MFVCPFVCLCLYTGLGGGYCERENVEYIDREESDDEIDEVCVLFFKCVRVCARLSVCCVCVCVCVCACVCLCLQFGRKKKKFRKKSDVSGSGKVQTCSTYLARFSYTV